MNTEFCNVKIGDMVSHSWMKSPRIVLAVTPEYDCCGKLTQFVLKTMSVCGTDFKFLYGAPDQAIERLT